MTALLLPAQNIHTPYMYTTPYESKVFHSFKSKGWEYTLPICHHGKTHDHQSLASQVSRNEWMTKIWTPRGGNQFNVAGPAKHERQASYPGTAFA